MTFHIVLPRAMQLGAAADQAARGECPRHSMGLLADALGARVHEPDDSRAGTADRLRAKLAPTESFWALARRLKASTGPNDVVFFSSEGVGLQFAAVCDDPVTRPKIVIFAHNLDRPRGRAALKLWGLRERVALFMACSQHQVTFLREYLELPAERVRFVWDHTDNRFFTPGPVSAGKKRPLLVSVGLEQRDYKTLAEASADLPLDVRISGFSKDAAALALTFPATLPENMSRRFYTWPDLVQLYRDADAVVVSCRENRYAAGVQSLMEASACARPVIATATQGLASYLDESVLRVPPGDAQAMRQAIQETLAHPAEAARRAERRHQVATEVYRMDRYVAEIEGALRALA